MLIFAWILRLEAKSGITWIIVILVEQIVFFTLFPCGFPNEDRQIDKFNKYLKEKWSLLSFICKIQKSAYFLKKTHSSLIFKRILQP